jgi:hypothetical protein
MQKKGWLTLTGFILLIVAILYGGPYLSLLVDNDYRKKINQNGIADKAVVFLKKTHKGNTVHFRYNYKNDIYKNNEQNDSLFDVLNIGDTINIFLDSTNPSASYILK